MRRCLDGAPRVAMERRTEWLAGEFSRARRRSKRKTRGDRPRVQSHARIEPAECPGLDLELRWNAERNGWRGSFQGLDGDRKGRRGLTDQECNRMLVLSPQNAKVGV